MALLWIDGFENYGTSVGSAPSPADVLSRKYVVGAESSMDIETGRDGTGYALQLPTTSTDIITPGLTTNRTLVCGFAIRFDTLSGSIAMFLNFKNLAGTGFNITVGSGELSARRSTTVLGSTSGLGLTTGVWYWMEVKCFCDNSGSYEIRLGGADVLSASGVDTQQSASYNYHDRVSFDTAAAALSTIDDLYVCDATGSVNNDFIGNSKVETLRPDADDTTGWDSSTEGTHYQAVDEVIVDDDTSYIETNGVGDKDLFEYGNTSNTTIRGLMITTDVRQTDATDFTLKHVVESNANELVSTALPIGATSYISKTEVFEQDHDASANWTQSTVNAAKFGVQTG